MTVVHDHHCSARRAGLAGARDAERDFRFGRYHFRFWHYQLPPNEYHVSQLAHQGIFSFQW
jgi:hypothetical protein